MTTIQPSSLTRKPSGGVLQSLLARIPNRRELLLVFTLTFVIVYTWSTIMFFHYLPGWILYLSNTTILGMFAYSQVFALFESTLVFLAVTVTAVLLPKRFFRGQFVSQAGAIVIVCAVCALVLQFAHSIVLFPTIQFFIGLTGFVVAILISSAVVRRSQRLQSILIYVMDRLVTLLFLYLPIIIISFVIIFLRNLF